MNEEAAQLERRIEAIRGNLTGIVRELDGRRHDLTDVKLQARRHAPALMATAAVVVGGVVLTGVLAAVLARRRRARRWRELRRALGRVVADPALLAGPKSPPMLARVAGAALAALAGVAAKQGGTSAIAYLSARREERRLRPSSRLVDEAARLEAGESPEPGWDALNPNVGALH